MKSYIVTVLKEKMTIFANDVDEAIELARKNASFMLEEKKESEGLNESSQVIKEYPKYDPKIHRTVLRETPI